MNDKSTSLVRGDDTSARPERAFAPPCDVYESADEYLVLADVPGTDEHNLDVKLDRAHLTVEASRGVGSAGTIIDTEHAAIRYRRSFRIPESVDANAIKAELRDGVLALHLPKAPAARMRRISVNAG